MDKGTKCYKCGNPAKVIQAGKPRCYKHSFGRITLRLPIKRKPEVK